MQLPAPDAANGANQDDGTLIVVRRWNFVGASAISEAELGKLLSPYTGREIGLPELYAATATVTNAYRERGYSYARASLPAQDITDGQVTVQLLEARLSEVVLDNHTASEGRRFQSLVGGFHIGQPLRASELERAVLLANDLPGIRAKAELGPGEQIGQTRVSLRLDQNRSYSGLVHVDNQGSESLDRNRVLASLSADNALGYFEHAQLTGVFNDDRLQFAQLELGKYLRPGTQLLARGLHSEYAVGGSFAALGVDGRAEIGTLALQQSWVRSLGLNLSSLSELAYKRGTDRTRAISANDDNRILSFSQSLSGDWLDDWWRGGYSALYLSYSYGELSILDPAQQRSDSLLLRSEGHFHVGRVQLQHSRRLWDGAQLQLSGQGQLASRNLHSLEEVGYGGFSGVRAYPQGEGTGDEGFLLRAELRQATAPVSEAPVLLAFADSALVRRNNQAFVGQTEDNARHLSGYGAGVEISTPFGVSGNLLFARPWGDAVSEVRGERATQYWFQFDYRFAANL